MVIKIAKVGSAAPIDFAAKELKRCLAAMDARADISILAFSDHDPKLSGLLWLGVCPQIAAQVADPTLDDSYRIVLVGLTTEQAKQMPANVIAIPRTNSPQELAEIYTTADVLFNPTYEDNYPTVNLEAQACGTPVITYNTGGSPETLNETGVVIEKQEFHALLKRLCD